MKQIARYFIPTFVGLMLTACGASRDSETDSFDEVLISGSVAYRERIALAPDSVVSVTLNDVSLADAAAVLIAEQAITTNGEQVPIPFKLIANRGVLEPRRTYSVRAEVRGPDDQLLWVTDTMHRLEFDTESSVVDMGMLPLKRVTPRAPVVGALPPLADTRWVIGSIDGQGSVDGSRPSITFGADGSLSGDTGCNAFSGSYSHDGSTLTTGQLLTTMRACTEMLEQQQENILRILNSAATISVNAEGSLVITSSADETLLALPDAQADEMN